MSNKKKLSMILKGKIDFIKKHNEHYFKYDDPKISDSEYDKIKKK